MPELCVELIDDVAALAERPATAIEEGTGSYGQSPAATRDDLGQSCGENLTELLVRAGERGRAVSAALIDTARRSGSPTGPRPAFAPGARESSPTTINCFVPS